MKNFYSTNKKKANKACFKRMACDIANEVCNFRPKRRKSHEDVYTSNYNSSDAGESDNYYEKKNFSSSNNEKTEVSSDCRETDESVFKLTKDIEFNSSEYDESINATELTGESINDEIVEILSDCRETEELALELINWLEITQVLGKYIFYYVDVLPRALVEEITINDDLLVKGVEYREIHELDINPINNIDEDVTASDIMNTQRECNNCIDTEQTINNTDKLMNKSTNKSSVKTAKMRKTKSLSSIDSVLEELEALLPDICEVVITANDFSRRSNKKVSRKNKLYKENPKELLMSSKDLAKKLRDMAEAIEGLSKGKTPDAKRQESVKKPTNKKPKSEAKLLALMEGDMGGSDQKIVLADLKVLSKRDIPYSDIKNILVGIFKFKPGEFAGLTRCPDNKGRYTFMVYEASLLRVIKNTSSVAQGQVVPWTKENLYRQVALAATVCNKILDQGSSLKAFKKAASSALKSLDGDVPCLVGEIIMRPLNGQNE